MGCNCKQKAPSSYLYTSATGERTTYRTEVEAQARKIKDKKASPTGITGSYVPVSR